MKIPSVKRLKKAEKRLVAELRAAARAVLKS